MTCIVAIKDGGKVHMGCDSIGTDGWRKESRVRPKLFKKGPLLVGWCGSFRMADLLEYEVEPPKLLPDEDVYPWLIKELIPVVRDQFKKGGFAKVENGVERGGSFLVAVRGRLFTVDSDYQVGETTRGYAAEGAGDTFAMGSIYSTHGQPAADRLRIALEAAYEMCATVAPPFHYLSED